MRKRVLDNGVRVLSVVFATVFLLLIGVVIPIKVKTVQAASSVAVAQAPWGDTNGGDTQTLGVNISTDGASYLLVAAMSQFDGSTPTLNLSVSGGGLTWTKLSGGIYSPTLTGGEMDLEYWGAYSPGPLSATITETVDVTAWLSMSIISLTGVRVAGPVGTTIAPYNSIGNLSDTFASTTAGSMLFAFCASPSGGSSWPSGNAGTTIYFSPWVDSSHIRSTNAVSGGTQTISITGWEAGASSYAAGIEILGDTPPPTPTANPVAGLFNAAQDIALLSAGASSVRYTTNGTDPTCSSGATYSTPIHIASTQTVKAIACTVNGLGSDVASFAYTIDTATPAITGTTVSADNSKIDVVFSEPVTGPSGATLLAANFTVGISSGNATGLVVDSVTDTSDAPLSGATSNIRFHVHYTGDASGSEIVTVNPFNGSSVYDLAINPMIAAQSNNMDLLHAATFNLLYTAAANGSIIGANPQTVAYGASGTAVTATADYGYRFFDWSDASTQNPRTDTNVTGNVSVTANFTLARGKKIDTTPVVITPIITIVIPNSSATYKADSIVSISWSSIDGAFTKYKVYYSSDSGALWSLIGETSSTSFSWTVPDVGTTQGKIKVEGFDAAGTLLASAANNGNLTVIGDAVPEPEEVTQPTAAPPAIDSTATGAYSTSEALENTPNIDIDKNLVAPTGMVGCVAGSLIKASLPSVYYCGADGKRYVFTSDRVYFSWYPDFSTVKNISDADLAKIPLGGNATYRPGKKMIKIQSDPKVYAISRGGILRWVSTKAKASELFGVNWNQQIDDVSDAFFVNYTVGAQL